MTLTYRDEEKVRQIVKEEVHHEVKEQLTKFRSDMKTSQDKILREVIAARQEMVMVKGHRDMLEDHESRLEDIEAELKIVPI